MSGDNSNKEYLGDGVYASFDGYQIWLTTDDGFEITNSIALEPPVYARLTQYVEKLRSPVDQPSPGDQQ